jgi:hypothetical protein
MPSIMMIDLTVFLCDMETQAFLKHACLEGVDGVYMG